MSGGEVVNGPWAPKESPKEQWLSKSRRDPAADKRTASRRRNKARLAAADALASAVENARGARLTDEVRDALNAYWVASGVEP